MPGPVHYSCSKQTLQLSRRTNGDRWYTGPSFLDIMHVCRWLIEAEFWRKPLLTTAEQRVMRTFRQFLVTPGQMLCFHGPNLNQNLPALKQLTEKEFLVKEQFNGGYSMTNAGYAAMNSCK